MSTHVDVLLIKKDGSEFQKPFYTDGFSEIFSESSTIKNMEKKMLEYERGRDWTDAKVTINEIRKAMRFNGPALWFDWPEIEKRLAYWAKKGWKIIINYPWGISQYPYILKYK